jgi:hypothetical protein
MDEIIFSKMAEYDVTCQTKNCENENILIRVNAAADYPIIVCGACSQIIQNVIEVN